MCGLYGMFTYGNPLPKNDTQKLIEALGIASAERGIHATGIAFLNKSHIKIIKAPKSAYDFKFKIPMGVKAVIGHTRLTTQGHQKYNPNNHPFLGRTKMHEFALAHNGILYNDVELRKRMNLPRTKIETDSYVAVQLLNKEAAINSSSLASVAEVVHGTFVFTVLDASGSLYIVKGNNPLSIVHFKNIKTYFYASTDDILWNGLANSGVFNISNKQFKIDPKFCENISIKAGNILHINSDGKLKVSSFKLHDCFYNIDIFTDRIKCNRYEDNLLNSEIDNDYYQLLKNTASYLGHDSDIVDSLFSEGFLLSEIEEFLYGEVDRNIPNEILI